MHRTINHINQIVGDGFVSTVRFLSDRKWVRTPNPDTVYVGEGQFRYRVARDWCKADPSVHPVRNCHEMVLARDGRLFVVTDHPQNNILVFDRGGRVVDAWTLEFRGAHGLSITADGQQEYLWICDPHSGSVVKTTLGGDVVQQLKPPHQFGAYSWRMPFMPTETAVGPDGSIYVADGYGSQFVLQYDNNGELIRTFGGRGRRTGALDFAHGVAIDDRAGPGRETLLVTSRRQSCIKRFSLDGEFQDQIQLPGGFPCRAVIHNQFLLTGLCWSGAHLRPNSGFAVMLDEDDQVCSTWGGVARFSESGKLEQLASDFSCFHHVHDICADGDNNLYACQWNAGQTYPIKLEPAPED